MRGTLRTFSVTASTVLLLGGVALACYQSSRSSVRLRSHVIAGTVGSSDGTPVTVALLTLKTSSPSLAGALHPNGHILADVTTDSKSSLSLAERLAPKYFTLRETSIDKDGSFSFGEFPAGKYLIVTRNGEIEVELVVPQKGQDDSVAILFFGMGCVGAKSVAVDLH
jgi:hypothetical protein